MKLNNEFVVSAPLDRTWATLLDVERVGNCLPGAQMEPADGEGLYRGRMKMKLGPMSMAYEGSARLVEVDDDAHASVMQVEGRDAKGQGTASATITNRLQEAEKGTLVRVETDLNVTGRQAQFGRGIMEDVAGRMLGQFAQQLEQLINEGQPAAAEGATNGRSAPDAPDAPHAPRPQADDDVLDMGSVFSGTITRNLPVVGGVVALLALLVVVARAVRSPRRSFRLEINL